MSDRITTTCQHSHTVTLRHEADVVGIIGATWTGGEEFHLVFDGGSYAVPIDRMAPAIRTELEVALAAAEALCGGCGCADRLRAEAERRAKKMGARRAGKTITYGLMHAADFLDAAPDARGSDLSAEQPAPVSEQGHAKKRAEWNDPKEATDG